MFRIFACLTRWANVSPAVRVVPYYERRLLETNTWLSGTRVAQNLLAFQEQGRSFELLTMGDLKFSPLPIEPTTLQWNLASEGLAAVQNSLTLVERHSAAFHETAELTTELEKMALAVRQAHNMGARFTLVRKTGFVSNNLEWCRGGGSV